MGETDGGMLGEPEPDSVTARVLGIDLGEKRVGLALSDRGTSVASPLRALLIDDAGRVVEELVSAVAELAPDLIVVGLPFRMDGSEGPAAVRARHIAEELSTETGLPVHLIDERLTSAKVHTLSRASATAEGARSAKGGGRRQTPSQTRRRKQALSSGGIDVLSATLILQTYMEGTAPVDSVGKGG